ncbi:unnamed protein product, partial [Amoebophrya sp. A120]
GITRGHGSHLQAEDRYGHESLAQRTRRRALWQKYGRPMHFVSLEFANARKDQELAQLRLKELEELESTTDEEKVKTDSKPRSP